MPKEFLFEIFDHMNSVDSILTHNFKSGKLELKKGFIWKAIRK